MSFHDLLEYQIICCLPRYLRQNWGFYRTAPFLATAAEIIPSSGQANSCDCAAKIHRRGGAAISTRVAGIHKLNHYDIRKDFCIVYGERTCQSNRGGATGHGHRQRIAGQTNRCVFDQLLRISFGKSQWAYRATAAGDNGTVFQFILFRQRWAAGHFNGQFCLMGAVSTLALMLGGIGKSCSPYYGA